MFTEERQNNVKLATTILTVSIRRELRKKRFPCIWYGKIATHPFVEAHKEMKLKPSKKERKNVFLMC